MNDYRYQVTGEGSARLWQVFPSSMSTLDVQDAWRAAGLDWDGQRSTYPGEAFSYPASVRRTATRVLVTQVTGLDI